MSTSTAHHLANMLVTAAILKNHPSDTVEELASRMITDAAEIIVSLIGEASANALLDEAVPLANKSLAPLGTEIRTSREADKEVADLIARVSRRPS